MQSVAELRQEWGTPLGLYLGLSQEFRFTLDAAATKYNAKCDRFYDKDKDGLAQDWRGFAVWCNPPYQNITPWVDKATRQGQAAVLSALLLPVRTEQAWWRTVMHHAIEIAFFDRRLAFEPPKGLTASANREASVLCIFGPTKWGRYETLRNSLTGAVISTWERKPNACK